MSELRQQMIDAVLVHGFSSRTHKIYLTAISKPIGIAGVSATELVRFWPGPAVVFSDLNVSFMGNGNHFPESGPPLAACTK